MSGRAIASIRWAVRPLVAAAITAVAVATPFVLFSVNAFVSDALSSGRNDDSSWFFVALNVAEIAMAAAVAAAAMVDRSGPVRRWNVLAGGIVGASAVAVWLRLLEGYVQWLSVFAAVLIALLGTSIAIHVLHRMPHRREVVGAVGAVFAIVAVVLLAPRIERSYERSSAAGAAIGSGLVE
jgi:hypothetical protein